MLTQTLIRKNLLLLTCAVLLTQQHALSAFLWAKSLSAQTLQTVPPEKILYHSQVPLSWELHWNNLKTNMSWVASNFFGIPRNGHEAQEMLTTALKNNRQILAWTAGISGGLLLASIMLWQYEIASEEYQRQHGGAMFGWDFFHEIDGPNLKKALAFAGTTLLLGTLLGRSWYIGKLKTFTLNNP